MPPPSVRISEGDPSDAFYHQFSTIIRLESRLQGDRSEDAIGPAHQRWVVRHLDEVARAQGFTSQLSTQTATLNVHAKEFITPSHAQPTISSRLGHITPWYENFNLADQGVYNISGPYYPTASTTAYYHLPYPPSPYNRLNPADLIVFREAVRAQPFQSSNQYTESQHSVPTEYLNYNPDPFRHPNYNHPRSHLPSTPPNNSPRVGYPSTPPNQPLRHPRQTSPTDSSPDLVATTMLRASTEPIAQSARMGFLTAPDHYIPLEIYALDVHIGDYIQSVKNPGTS